MPKVLKFPDGFLWGSATSAYQVEGGIENCDWSKVYPAGRACDHYNLYEKDFDLLKELNQNAYRFSIEWSRIEPEEGKFDQKEIEHYRKVLISLKKRKIEPFVTLWHWTIPLWFSQKGGWLNPKSSEYFERYIEKIVKELKDYAVFWITLNEPEIYINGSFLQGIWPPKEKNLLKAIKVIKNLIKAHKKAYLKIHSLNPRAKVGIAKNNNYFEAYKNKTINKVLVFLADYFWNKYFLNQIKNHQDCIGLNYYFHNRIKFSFKNPFRAKGFFNQNENNIISDLGWEIYPEGIYYCLKGFQKYKKPIYVTENGLADANDRLRKDFIRGHLYWVHKVIQEDVDVRGYFHWSLMDNFEWEKGFGPRFGLIEIDYKIMRRKPRPSAFYYAEICKNNGLMI